MSCTGPGSSARRSATASVISRGPAVSSSATDARLTVLLVAPGELVDDVLDEERVAAGDAVHGVLDLARRVREPEGAHHLSGLFFRERSERDRVTDLFPPESFDVFRERRGGSASRYVAASMTATGSLMAVSAISSARWVNKSSDARSAQWRSSRTTRSGRRSASRMVAAATATKTRVCSCSSDRVAARRWALGVVAEQSLDDGCVPAQCRVLASEELQPREQRRRERQVREVEVLTAPARGHLHAAARSRPLHLAHEPGLPDSGLARDQDQLRLTAPGVVEALLEPLALVVSIDERASARRLLPDHRNPQLARAPRRRVSHSAPASSQISMRRLQAPRSSNTYWSGRTASRSATSPQCGHRKTIPAPR